MGWKVSSGRHSTLCPLKGWSCEAEPSGLKALAAGRGVDPFLHTSRCASCLWELPEGLGMGVLVPSHPRCSVDYGCPAVPQLRSLAQGTGNWHQP